MVVLCTWNGMGRVLVLFCLPICCHYHCINDTLLTFHMTVVLAENEQISYTFMYRIQVCIYIYIFFLFLFLSSLVAVVIVPSTLWTINFCAAHYTTTQVWSDSGWILTITTNSENKNSKNAKFANNIQVPEVTINQISESWRLWNYRW